MTLIIDLSLTNALPEKILLSFYFFFWYGARLWFQGLVPAAADAVAFLDMGLAAVPVLVPAFTPRPSLVPAFSLAALVLDENTAHSSSFLEP